jgi:uncharacterized protein (DUF1330 family)
MAKAYMVVSYRSISDAAALATYAELAGPAIRQAGGRFLARGPAAGTFEAGIAERVVIIEYENVEQAVAAYQSESYQKALTALGTAAERDIRIVEGLD